MLPTVVTKMAVSHSIEEVLKGEGDERPFRLVVNFHMYVPKDALVVLVGLVGSGKVSVIFSCYDCIEAFISPQQFDSSSADWRDEMSEGRGNCFVMPSSPIIMVTTD